MKYNFSEEIERAEKQYGVSRENEWFSISEGSNKIRILSEGEPLAEKFKLGIVYGSDKGYPYIENDEKIPRTVVKFLTWIIDRKDNKIKLFKIPYTIMKQISALQNNPDYEFDSLPMPYDITIVAKNAGTREVEYSITPARTNVPVTEEETKEFFSKKSVKEIVQRMKDNQIAKHKEMGIWVDRSTRSQEVRKEDSLIPLDQVVDYPTEDINPDEMGF